MSQISKLAGGGIKPQALEMVSDATRWFLFRTSPWSIRSCPELQAAVTAAKAVAVASATILKFIKHATGYGMATFSTCIYSLCVVRVNVVPFLPGATGSTTISFPPRAHGGDWRQGRILRRTHYYDHDIRCSRRKSETTGFFQNVSWLKGQGSLTRQISKRHQPRRLHFPITV